MGEETALYVTAGQRKAVFSQNLHRFDPLERSWQEGSAGPARINAVPQACGCGLAIPY